jgi:pimeloyl-ACP methyl ester carboxylesterase
MMTTLLLVVLGVLGGLLAALLLFTVWTAGRVEKALPPHGQFADVPGGRIHYWQQGSGTAIVMVHGLGGQSANFAYGVVEQLADDFRVIVIDRPGAGYSTRNSDRCATLREQAKFVAEFIRALGLQRPWLVGHSLGGAISLQAALDYPDAIGGLVLLAPLTHLPPQVPQMFRRLDIQSRLLRRAIAWTLATPVGMVIGPRTIRAIFAPEPVPRDIATRGRGLLSLRPSHFYNVSTDLMSVNADLQKMTQLYGHLRVPVAILFGTSDQVLDYRQQGQAMQQKIAHLQLKLVEGGHMLPVTQPELCAQFIRATVAATWSGRVWAAEQA